MPLCGSSDDAVGTYLEGAGRSRKYLETFSRRAQPSRENTASGLRWSIVSPVGSAGTGRAAHCDACDSTGSLGINTAPVAWYLLSLFHLGFTR